MLKLIEACFSSGGIGSPLHLAGEAWEAKQARGHLGDEEAYLENAAWMRGAACPAACGAACPAVTRCNRREGPARSSTGCRRTPAGRSCFRSETRAARSAAP